MRSVVEAFRNAPITNLDGNNGINARRYAFHYALAIHVDRHGRGRYPPTRPPRWTTSRRR